MAQADADLLVRLDAVDLYSIKGQEKTHLGLGDLNLLQAVTQDAEGNDVTITFFVVGDFTCPLAKHIPSLRMEKGYYVFPLPDAFYGVQVPESVSDEIISKFETALDTYSSFRRADEKPLTTADKAVVKTGGVVVTGLEKGSAAVVTGVTKTADFLGKGLRWGGNFLISKLKPNETPTQVSERVERNVAKAKTFSGVAVKVSATLVQGVVAMSQQIAGTIATELKDTGVGKSLGGESGPKITAAKEVAAAAIVAVGDIQTALWDAGTVLVKQTGDATADVLEHKYGEEVGEVTRDGFSIATDVTKTGRNMTQLGPKAVVKKTAKRAAVNLVTDDKDKQERADPIPDTGITDGAGSSSDGAITPAQTAADEAGVMTSMMMMNIVQQHTEEVKAEQAAEKAKKLEAKKAAPKED